MTFIHKKNLKTFDISSHTTSARLFPALCASAIISLNGVVFGCKNDSE